MLPTDKQARKERPIARGFLDYFPDAVAAVAHVSFVGNQQHNPGQELHWAREKSTDHADCVARHLIERGTIDDDGVRHTAKAAWRIMALLQLEIEATLEYDKGYGQPVNPADSEAASVFNATQPYFVEKYGRVDGLNIELDEKVGSDAKELTDWLNRKDDERHQRFVDLGSFLVVPFEDIPFVDEFTGPNGEDLLAEDEFDFVVSEESDEDFYFLIGKGCDPDVAQHILAGTTYQNSEDAPYVYVSGPMRGITDFNFPKFDMYRDAFAANGYNVISPADIDRSAGLSEGDQSVYVYRDFYSLLLVAHRKGYIHMLEGHEKSVGATAELALAKWLGIIVRGVNQ